MFKTLCMIAMLCLVGCTDPETVTDVGQAPSATVDVAQVSSSTPDAGSPAPSSSDVTPVSSNLPAVPALGGTNQK